MALATSRLGERRPRRGRAEPLLARADQLDGDALVLRDLGIAQLALERKAEAVATLDVRDEGGPVADRVGCSRRARTPRHGDIAGARAALRERARRPSEGSYRRGQGVEVALDWAASELAGGDPAIAVAALEKTAAAAKAARSPPATRRALADARHAAGVAPLRTGNGPNGRPLARRGRHRNARYALRPRGRQRSSPATPPARSSALKAVTGQACPFPAPADTQAAPILPRSPRASVATAAPPRPRQAAPSLDGKSSGPAAALLGTAIRVVALEAAQDAYRSGQPRAARKYLATARAAECARRR